MWIRIESFPSDSSPENSSAVWNYFCGNLGASEKESGVLFALGRKEGDITFPTDKSVSRQHCVLRCFQASAKDSSDLPAPRNDAEREACANNPFGMCLVVENTGKAGAFLAEVPEKVEEDPAKDGDTSDDDETDDEGIISQKSQGGKKSQPLGALGDGKLAMEDLSRASKYFYWQQRKEEPQLIKLDVGESRVLRFPSRDDTSSNNNAERSIMMQVGLNGSTLKITWVRFILTFSSIPKPVQQEWKRKFHRIGAMEEPQLSRATTHLITPEMKGSAKPMIAWCWGIPIVTLTYLEALTEYKSGQAPVPLASDFIAPPKDANDKYVATMQSSTANPNLMSSYIVLSCEARETDLLVDAAGAALVALYTEPNAEAMVRRAKQALEEARQSKQVCLVLSSKKRVFNKVAHLDGITSVNSTDWARAVLSQDPALEDSKGNVIALPSQQPDVQIPPRDDSDTEDEGTASQNQGLGKMETQDVQGTHDDKQRVSAVKKRKGEDSQSISHVDSSETQVPIPKRQKRGEEQDDELAAYEEAKQQATSDNRSKRQRPEPEIVQEPSPEDEGLSLDQVEPSKEDEQESESSMPRHVAKRAEVGPKAKLDNPQEFLGKANANGWFTVAPKDNGTRRAWRNKMSKAHAEQHDGSHFMPPAQSEHVSIVTPSSVSGGSNGSSSGRDAPVHHSRRSDAPDFKRFRKNIVPYKVDACEHIRLEAMQARESEQHLRLEETQRELEAEQRRADELFRDIGGGGTTRRRRR